MGWNVILWYVVGEVGHSDGRRWGHVGLGTICYVLWKGTLCRDINDEDDDDDDDFESLPTTLNPALESAHLLSLKKREKDTPSESELSPARLGPAGSNVLAFPQKCYICLPQSHRFSRSTALKDMKAIRYLALRDNPNSLSNHVP